MSKVRSAGKIANKTVYIVGAGFSFDAGFPLQAQLLDKVLDYDLNILSGKNTDDFLGLSELLLPAINNIKDFLKIGYAGQSTPPLEDVFTLLDQAISQRAHCFGFPWKKLDDVRVAFNTALLFILHDALHRHFETKDEFYKALAGFFISERIKAGQKADPLSIVTLNWDSLLDDSIYWCIKKLGVETKIDVDYCCYTTPLVESSKHTPSVVQKAKGIHNVKLLKLHGSSNWMRCPNCNRTFTGLGASESIWSLYVHPRSCQYCSLPKDKAKEYKLTKLEPYLITPTYVKVFDNSHIQMIWHNAYVEIAEADRVVFMGYSLPNSDYHLRTLLKRALRSEAEIHVVLTKHDSPPRKAVPKIRNAFAKTRYQEFFGKDRVKFYMKGVRAYFNELGVKKTASRLTAIRKSLRSKR